MPSSVPRQLSFFKMQATIDYGPVEDRDGFVIRFDPQLETTDCTYPGCFKRQKRGKPFFNVSGHHKRHHYETPKMAGKFKHIALLRTANEVLKRIVPVHADWIAMREAYNSHILDHSESDLRSELQFSKFKFGKYGLIHTKKSICLKFACAPAYFAWFAKQFKLKLLWHNQGDDVKVCQ